MKNLLSLVCLLSILGCASGPGVRSGSEGAIPPHAPTDRIYEKFSEAYVALDPSLVASLYTEDAVYLQPQGDVMRGRAAIEENFRSFFDRVRDRGDSLRIAFTLREREVREGIVWDVGYYDLSVLGPDGATKGTSRGKFNTIAIPGDDGVWRFRLDAYSGVD